MFKKIDREININRIALYLAWKLKQHNKPQDKMEFIDEMMWLFYNIVTESTFNFIQKQSNTEEQYYSMCLSKAQRIDEKKFIILLDKIKVPENVRMLCLEINIY